MPTNPEQWAWFIFYTGGSVGGWLIPPLLLWLVWGLKHERRNAE